MTRRYLGLLFALAWPSALAGQGASPDGRNEVFVGSELEQYLRFLQADGRAGLYPWSIGGFSPREIDRIVQTDSGQPWARHYLLDPRANDGVRLIPPVLTTIANTTFPYGSNDGPIWAGRGVTNAVQMGLSARYGPVSLAVDPMFFSAQNAAFPLESNGRGGDTAFADGRNPLDIDRPQRFGNRAYTVVDPGQSTLRLDLHGLALGVSTANQRWGPGEIYPIILGDNAAGFPHAFLGTSVPLDLWLFRIHGRLEWGELFQSDYSTDPADSSKRFMSGVVAVILPRGIPGLELGGGRFFHTPWPADGLTFADFRKPIEALFKSGLPTQVAGQPHEDLSNQLASAFFRWVFPASGFELYGEYGREDHSYNLRDYWLEPDHSGGYMLGIRKTWRRGTDRFVGLRAEMVNLEVSTLVRSRGEGPFYVHGLARQGHTYRGQVLGADVGSGGAGSTLAVDHYHPGGRWSVSWSRVLRQDIGDYWQTGVLNAKSMDVVHTLMAEVLVFRGRFDVTGRIAGSYEFNRDFLKDAFNLNAVVRVRVGLSRKQ